MQNTICQLNSDILMIGGQQGRCVLEIQVQKITTVSNTWWVSCSKGNDTYLALGELLKQRRKIYTNLGKYLELHNMKMLFNINYHYSQATQVAQWVESACSAGETRHKFNSWLKNIPWKRAGQSTPVFLSGESHGQRGMACYSPQGCKELDKTEVIQHTNKHHYSHVYSSWYIPRHIESQKTVLD